MEFLNHYSGLGALLLSIGAVVVAVATRLNHIEHIKEEQIRIAKEVEEVKKSVSETRELVAGMDQKIDGIIAVCKVRHEGG